MTLRDPVAMTPDERLAEIAVMLAGAYVRLLASRKESHNFLAEAPQSEAPCAAVNAQENAVNKESA